MKKSLTMLSICAAIVIVAAALLAPAKLYPPQQETAFITASDWMAGMR